MLREYRLTNFKAFGETVTIPIRPLTLIFGANSSGKSSIFQSMLLLKQTLEESKNPDTALLPKGSLVDLGTYSDFIHCHKSGLSFEFGARFTLNQFPDAPWERAIFESMNVKTVGINVELEHKTERGITILDRLSLTVGDEARPSISYSPSHGEPSALKRFGNRGETRLTGTTQVEIDPETAHWHHLWKLTKENKFRHLDWLNDRLSEHDGGADKRWHQERKREWSLEKSFIQALGSYDLDAILKGLIVDGKLTADYSPRNFFLDFPPRGARLGKFSDKCVSNLSQSLVEKLLEDEALIVPDPPPKYILRSAEDLLKEGLNIFSTTEHICSFFRHLLEDLVHIGPLRSHPERYYEFSGDTPDHVGQSGEHLPSLLFKEPELLRQINGDLERLNMIYQLKLDKLQYEDASPSNIFSLRLVDTDTGIDASLRDVGFGISQMLPIVVQSLLSENKTLLIEQPEIHLHPAHQAELGDLFIRSAKEQGNTLLLETHSENLILRILRRIRETTEDELPSDLPPIRPEDVAVLYVQPGEKGAQVVEIPVTEDGDFDRPWPQGFFEESIKELV